RLAATDDAVRPPLLVADRRRLVLGCRVHGALPIETASDCPGQEALDKASYVGFYSHCRAGALVPRQLPKNHTASPRGGPFWADTHAFRGIFLCELIGESGRSRACFLEGSTSASGRAIWPNAGSIAAGRCRSALSLFCSGSWLCENAEAGSLT